MKETRNKQQAKKTHNNILKQTIASIRCVQLKKHIQICEQMKTADNTCQANSTTISTISISMSISIRISISISVSIRLCSAAPAYEVTNTIL